MVAGLPPGTGAEVAGWLRLLLSPGLGRESARRLLAAFGSAEAIFKATPADWSRIVNASAATALAAPPVDLAAQVDATLNWLADAPTAGPRRAIVTLGDAAYPAALLEVADPPLLLFVQGRVEMLAAPGIAIVGSRNPTAQGADNARAFAAHLSGVGLTVVSGMAHGIDAAAHEGALTGPGATIAVVGTGVDRVYPRSHRDLAHRIAAAGVVVSEYALATPPLPHNFPQRNRIIAALSRGTLVVEAALQSGSLITARLAAEAGREVFAIPGSIHSPQSRGCHALIRQGAKLVETAHDIVEELGVLAVGAGAADGADTHSRDSPVPSVRPDEPADAVMRALGHDPVTLDALISRCGWPAAELSARLLELELDGQLARLPGGLFQRRSRG
jgi:DNA processing protein